MNLHLSDWEWLRVVTSLLFIWRGIQDLRDRSGTAWKTEDERKNFRKFSGVTLILGGAAFLFNTILPDIEPWNIILQIFRCDPDPRRCSLSVQYNFAGHRAVEYHSAGSGISGLHRFCHLQPVLPRQPGRQG